jgi:DNA segregation ATPase FtsK/SpoIIIE-like protein
VRFNVLPAMGATTTKIKRLSEELAAALGADDCRVKRRGAAVDVEIPRDCDGPAVRLLSLQRQMEQLERRGMWHMPPATATLGLDEEGAPLLIRLPAPDVAHVLVSGMTGAGKTTLLQDVILSLAMTNAPHEMALVLAGPRESGFSLFEPLPHLARPPIQRGGAVVEALKSLLRLMERREAGERPRVVAVIDGLGALLQAGGDAIQEPLTRLLQCGADVGIHVVAATEQPRIVSEYGFPVRVVGRVADTSEAHVASGRRGTGAERLREGGDFIAVVEGKMIRFQAAHVTPEEIRSTASELAGEPHPPGGQVVGVLERTRGRGKSDGSLPDPAPGTVGVLVDRVPGGER